MKQEIQLSKELEKLKSDPHYIDLFCRTLSTHIGENHELIKSILDEAIAFYHKEQYPNIYGQLMSLQLRERIIAGELYETIHIGEKVLEELFEDKSSSFSIWLSLLEAYTEMGQAEKANEYKEKLVEALNEDSCTHDYIDVMLGIVKFYMRFGVSEEAHSLLEHLNQLSQWMSVKQDINLSLLKLELLLSEEQVDKAIVEAQKVYNLVSPFEKDKSHGYELGQVFRLRGKLNQMRALAMQAEKDFKLAAGYSRTYKSLHVKCLMDWGNYLISEEEYEKAQEKIRKAIEIAEDCQLSEAVSKANESLSKIEEMSAHWKKAYERLKRSKDKSSKPYEIKMVASERSVKISSETDNLITKIARLGQVFSSTFTVENIQKENVEELIRKELSTLVEMDLMGIALVEKGKIQYNVYDLQEGWLEERNALVKYTTRIVEHCIQFHMDLTIQDGNFEEYTLKSIENTVTGKKLGCAIVKLLIAENQVIGAMFIGNYKYQVYSTKDIELAEIMASYMGLTLKNTRLYDKINYLSEHDQLTGLLSRSVVMRSGEKLFKENHKKHKKTAIMMLDTDQFKLVNTKYGYVLGDEVLSRIGEIICESVRPGDYVGRYGSKAFIIIIDDPNSDQEVNEIAQKIMRALKESTFETKKDKNIKVTLSGGIYICNEYTLNFDDAIRYADHALYRAKLLGRNRILSYNMVESRK